MSSSHPVVPLAELCEAIVDCEHKTAPLAAHGHPSIRTTDIKNGRIDFDGANRVSEQTYRSWTQRLEPEPGDLILAREAPVGEVGIIPEGVRPCLGQRTVLLRPNSSRIVPRYLMYTLVSPGMRHALTSRAEGCTVPHLNVADIRQLPIPEPPPLPEQQRTADTLGALDDKIELNRRMNSVLESIARAIFKSWFIDADSFCSNGEGDEEDLPPSLVESPAARPGGARSNASSWGAGVLGDVAKQIRLPVQPSQLPRGTPYFGLEHMPRNSIALEDWGVVDDVDSAKSLVSPGDLLFGKLRPYFHKVGPAPVEGVCSTDIIVVRPREPHMSGFLLGHLSSDPFVAYASASASGTRMPRANWRDLSNYPILIPPRSALVAFESFVKPIVSSIHHSILEIHTLREIRDLLLPGLISGRLACTEGRLS